MSLDIDSYRKVTIGYARELSTIDSYTVRAVIAETVMHNVGALCDEVERLRATVQNAEIVMAALRERDALVRQAARAFVGVATYPAWASDECRCCGNYSDHAETCEYATARAALVALVEGGPDA